MITNPQSGTRVDEIERGIYRISTPLPPEAIPGGFSFNQYLVVDDEPLLFHTGPRAMFPLVREAIESVMPVARLRWIGLSHVESDESGAMNDFLRVAPEATPVCGLVAAMVSVNDLADRPPRPLAHGEELVIGSRTMVWLDAPHVPHNWETGYLFDKTTRTLFCGDLFTQGGADCAPLTESDILEPSEAFRLAGVGGGMPDYVSLTPETRAVIARIAETHPTTLACMHGSAWRATNGGGAAQLLHGLADRLMGGAA
jgi:glyoxylase-like metal-dependent hydrolase (beta-lactamase superfamily II)